MYVRCLTAPFARLVLVQVWISTTAVLHYIAQQCTAITRVEQLGLCCVFLRSCTTNHDSSGCICRSAPPGPANSAHVGLSIDTGQAGLPSLLHTLK